MEFAITRLLFVFVSFQLAESVQKRVDSKALRLVGDTTLHPHFCCLIWKQSTGSRTSWIFLLSYFLASICSSESTAPCIDDNGLGYNLTFTIHYDSYPEEISWVIGEYSDGSFNTSGTTSIILSGNGTSAPDYDIMSQSVCVSRQDNYCYSLTIFDSFGDGIDVNSNSTSDYGFFSLTLDGVFITLDKQTFDNDISFVYFCPSLFDISQTTNWLDEDAPSSNTFKIEMYDINTNLMIVDANNSNTDNNTLFYDDFNFGDNILTNVSSVFYLHDGCYNFSFINNVVDTTDGYISLFWKDLSVIQYVPSGDFLLGPICFNTFYNLTFTIRVDNWENEVSWEMIELDGSSVIFSGNSNSLGDYATVTQAEVIGDGCFRLSVYDSYGDGISSNGNYGWFNIYLNDKLISIGNQTLDDSQADIEFCTQLFDMVDFDLQGYNFNNNTISISLYDYSSDILITDAGDSNIIYYSTDYEFMDYYSSIVTNTIYLNDGCYDFSFTNNVIDTTSGQINVVINGETIIATSSNTTNKVIDDLCIVRGENIYATIIRSNLDYYFNVGENGDFIDSQTFGCTTAGCSVTKEWLVTGNCYYPTLTIDIVETDFGFTSEEAYIYVNGEYLGSCEPLDQDATHDWVTCDIADELDLTSLFGSDYLSDGSGSGVLTIEVAISSDVNCCGYYASDGNYYYLYSEVTVDCDVYPNVTTPAPVDAPTALPTVIPTASPTSLPTLPSLSPTDNPTYIYQNSAKKFLTTSWSATHWWTELYFNIIGYEDAWISQFEIMCWIAGTYQFKIEILNQLNGTYENYIGNGSNYDSYWTTVYDELVTCGESYSFERVNITLNYAVSVYQGYKQAFGFSWSGGMLALRTGTNGLHDVYAKDNNIGVSVGVSRTKAIDNILYYDEVICSNIYYYGGSNSSWTEIDYYFNVSQNGNFFDSQRFGCTIPGCNVVKSWAVNGNCYNPTLTVRVVETDFGWSWEEAYVYLNDRYLGSCEPLDEDATHDWVTCEIADELDLTSLFGSDYLSDGTGSGVLTVKVAISSDVDCCVYLGDDGIYYYLYSEATLQCDIYPNVTTPAPSSIAPTTSPTNRPTFDPDLERKTLTTTFSHTHYWDALYFNVIAYQNVTVDQFTIMCWTLGTHQLTVLILNEINGTFENFIGNDSYWTIIYHSSVTCNSYAEKHNVTFASDKDVLIYAGYKQAFGFKYAGIMGNKTGTSSFGAVHSRNDDLGITIGIGDWAGTLNYDDVMCTTVYYSHPIDTFSTTMTKDSTTTVTNDSTITMTGASKLTTTTRVSPTYELSDVVTTPRKETTSGASFCNSNDLATQELEFSIKTDDWPEEISWLLYEAGTSDEPILRGNGSDLNDFAQIDSVGCLNESTCYYLIVNDSYGDGMDSDGDYGWFELDVNSQSVTLGKQGVGRHGTSLYFCTDVFQGDAAAHAHVVDFTVVTFKEGKKSVTISLYDKDNNVTKYINNYFMRNYNDNSRRRRRRRRRLIGRKLLQSTTESRRVENDISMTLDDDTDYEIRASRYFELIDGDGDTYEPSYDSNKDRYYISITGGVIVDGRLSCMFFLCFFFFFLLLPCWGGCLYN